MSEWQETQLGSVTTLRNGFAFKSSDFVPTGVPVIKIKNVKPNQIVLDDLSYVAESLAAQYNQHLIRNDEILITMSGNRSDGSPESWVGKAAKFKPNGTYLLNQRVSAIRVSSEKVDLDFLTYHLSSWDTQLELINHSNSSGGQATFLPVQLRT